MALLFWTSTFWGGGASGGHQGLLPQPGEERRRPRSLEGADPRVDGLDEREAQGQYEERQGEEERLVAIELEGDTPPSKWSSELEAHYFECVNCGQKRTYPLSKSG